MAYRIYNSFYGHRPKSNWGDGDLVAPYAEGDIVFIPFGCLAIVSGRVSRGEGMYRVTTAFSISKADSWYFRVSKMVPKDRGGRWTIEYENSGRLHSIPAQVDYTDNWPLLFTADPEGLEARRAYERERFHQLSNNP